MLWTLLKNEGILVCDRAICGDSHLILIEVRSELSNTGSMETIESKEENMKKILGQLSANIFYIGFQG